MRLALLCCAALLVGCGGNGGGGTEPPPTSLAGEWSGPWTSADPDNLPPAPGDSGSFELTISANGTVTGTCVNTGYNETGTVSGTVTPEGGLNLTVNYPTKTDAIVYGEPGSDLTGRIIFGSEEYTRTIHLYQVNVALNRE